MAQLDDLIAMPKVCPTTQSQKHNNNYKTNVVTLRALSFSLFLFGRLD